MKRKNQKGKGVMDALRFIKNNHLISGGLGLLPSPTAQAVSAVAKLVGLGKRKRKPAASVKRVRGGGIFSDIGGGFGNAFNGLGHGLFGSGPRKKRKVIMT